MMTPISDALLAFILPGHTEWLVLLVLGLLIFGRRLPEVGRSLGRGIVEFKRGIKGIEDEVEGESSRPLPKPAPPEKLVNRRSATGGSGGSGGGTAAAPEKASRTRDPETVAARDDATESDDDNG